MPRKLYVTDEMGLDDALCDIAENDLPLALMWPWLIPYFDDWGRAEASARRIKGKIFPNFAALSVQAIETMLSLFAGHGLIELYEADGKRYMAVEREKWFRFQTHIHASKRTGEGSRYPSPPSEDAAPLREAEQSQANPPRKIAEVRDAPRDDAPSRASPSPTLSPSPSLTKEKTPPSPPMGDALGSVNGSSIFIDCYRERFNGDDPLLTGQQHKKLAETWAAYKRDEAVMRQTVRNFMADEGAWAAGHDAAKFVISPDRWRHGSGAARASPAVHPMKAGLAAAAKYEEERIGRILGESG